jgi:hypothetical protein
MLVHDGFENAQGHNGSHVICCRTRSRDREPLVSPGVRVGTLNVSQVLFPYDDIRRGQKMTSNPPLQKLLKIRSQEYLMSNSLQMSRSEESQQRGQRKGIVGNQMLVPLECLPASVKRPTKLEQQSCKSTDLTYCAAPYLTRSSTPRLCV